MKKLKIIFAPLSHTAPLTLECDHATRLLERTRGLLGRHDLEPQKGLLIEPCTQVHTFFMRFAIDVLFLNRDNEIIAVESLKPWRISRIHPSARKVLELPYSSASRFGLHKGHRLEIQAC